MAERLSYLLGKVVLLRYLENPLHLDLPGTLSFGRLSRLLLLGLSCRQRLLKLSIFIEKFVWVEVLFMARNLSYLETWWIL
jgi:hypothetical protein